MVAQLRRHHNGSRPTAADQPAATGDLGGRILRNLVASGATVRVLTRPATSTERITQLRAEGAEVIQTGYDDPTGLRRACTGVDCVVSGPETTGTCSSAETSHRVWTPPKSGPRRSSTAPSLTCFPGRRP
ncbi:SDR family oxidoreductase [Arthrobacter sp. PsM3]|uniref:SDR family oxidoreductase n=1 Tax=Arthrobacter sp. PsM3 TaxID=3030531 RepID=UPI00345F98F9